MTLISKQHLKPCPKQTTAHFSVCNESKNAKYVQTNTNKNRLFTLSFIQLGNSDFPIFKKQQYNKLLFILFIYFDYHHEISMCFFGTFWHLFTCILLYGQNYNFLQNNIRVNDGRIFIYGVAFPFTDLT